MRLYYSSVSLGMGPLKGFSGARYGVLSVKGTAIEGWNRGVSLEGGVFVLRLGFRVVVAVIGQAPRSCRVLSPFALTQILCLATSSLSSNLYLHEALPTSLVLSISVNQTYLSILLRQ